MQLAALGPRDLGPILFGAGCTEFNRWSSSLVSVEGFEVSRSTLGEAMWGKEGKPEIRRGDLGVIQDSPGPLGCSPHCYETVSRGGSGQQATARCQWSKAVSPRLSFSGLSPLFLNFYHTFTALSHAFGGYYRFMLNIACRKQLCKAVCTV